MQRRVGLVSMRLLRWPTVCRVLWVAFKMVNHYMCNIFTFAGLGVVPGTQALRHWKMEKMRHNSPD